MAKDILTHDDKFFHLINGKKVKTITRWAGDIEKIHRIDGREWKVIWAVIKWARKDDFWRVNIQSGKKARAQFSALFLRAKKEGALIEHKKAKPKHLVDCNGCLGLQTCRFSSPDEKVECTLYTARAPISQALLPAVSTKNMTHRQKLMHDLGETLEELEKNGSPF